MTLSSTVEVAPISVDSESLHSELLPIKPGFSLVISTFVFIISSFSLQLHLECAFHLLEHSDKIFLYTCVLL